MAFPDDPVPVTVEIAPGADPGGDPGDWLYTDITTSVRLADRIDIKAGRPNEAGSVDPSRCTLRLDNTSGDFTPRNAYGQWYGQLTRNTPLRVSVRRVEDAFGRTSSTSWGTADSGQVWSVYGAGGSVLATDFPMGSGKGSHSVPVASAYRTSWLPDLSLRDCRVHLSGVSLPFTNVLSGSVEPGNILLRAQSLTEYYLARVEITTAEAVLCKLYDPTGVELASATASGLTHTTAQTLEVLADITGTTLAMKVWATGTDEPAGWTVTATDDTLALPGGIGVRTGVAAGNTNTLPIVASYDSITVYVDRFSGFVSSWPPRWDKSGVNATVPIQADGVLRRLSQGTPASRSAMRRTIGGSGPVAYWPVEDGVTAGRAGSAIAAHPPMTVAGTVEFRPMQDYTTPGLINNPTTRYGTSALADLAGGGSLSATLPPAATAATAAAWTVHVTTKVDPATISGDVVLMEWTTPGGSFVRWRLVTLAAINMQVIGYNAAGAATVVLNRGSARTVFDTFAVGARQVGGNIEVEMYTSGAAEPSGTVAGTLAGVTSIAVNPTAATATVDMPFGHVAVWASDARPFQMGAYFDSYGEIVWDALRSHQNEAGHLRLARLAAEDGAPLTVPSVPAEAVTRMGWQPAGTPLDLYRQCENADHGVLYESGFGLSYLPRDLRYNRPVSLALDFDAGQVAEPPEPVDDDQQLVNRVTVRRVDGSEWPAEDPASIAAVGMYETSVEVNVADDADLADHAGWRVHLGTVDEMRWPRIDVNLARSPELIDAVLSSGVQSRMTADNPPVEVAGDDIDVIVEGWSETIGYTEWTVSLNCSPASPWDVAEVDGDPRVAADGTTLAAAVTSSALTMQITSTAANRRWTTTVSDFPQDLRVGGERVTASGITGTGLTQTVTLSARGVNGVSRAWDAGTEVDVWQPAIGAL